MEQLLVLRDLAVIFGASLVVVLVFHRLRLPALPGFIVAGVVLGPNALGLIPDVHRVEGLAEVGVILLLFTIGIEFSLTRLREMGRQVVVAGACQVGLTVAATAAAAAAGTTRWQVALFLGFLAALSSTAIVLKLLTEKGAIDTPHPRLAHRGSGPRPPRHAGALAMPGHLPPPLPRGGRDAGAARRRPPPPPAPLRGGGGAPNQ